MTKNAPALPSSSATITHATASSSSERMNSQMEQAAKIAVETRISAVHQQARLLQSFAAQSKRKLSLGKALEQAAQLSGHKDYQTAKATIEKEEADRLALSKVQVAVMSQPMAEHEENDGMVTKIADQIAPWESDKGYKNGEILIKQYSDSVSVSLSKQGSPETAIEVIFEMDVDLPRLCIYTPGTTDDPVLSLHSDDAGLVLQYLPEDDQMYPKNRADEDGLAMIKKVAHASRGVWFIPKVTVDEEE